MATFDLIIRNGSVLTPQGEQLMDIAISGGTISEIARSIAGSAIEEIDASGSHVFPGLIDAHVHFNEPGRTGWEGFATGSAALAAGGGTCFIEMPLNASPPTLDAASFDAKRKAAEQSSLTDFALWGGLTPGNLDHLEALAARGVVGFKAFMCNSGIADFPRADDTTLKRGMEIAAGLDLPVAVHAESEEITARLSAQVGARGLASWDDYLATRPPIAETEAISRVIHLAAETGCSLHIVHVSTARGVNIVAHAAREGIDVSCETCPHYLLLNESDLRQLGARAKCAPPLRPAGECDKLWQKLEDDAIHFVASDHSPAPASMKTGADAMSIWGGIAGVQSTLASLLNRPAVPPTQIAKLTATRVADRFRLSQKGRISLGCDADFALVDLSAPRKLAQSDLLDRHKLSPYVGRTFGGNIRRTIARGQTIFRDGKTYPGLKPRLVVPGKRAVHA